MSEVTFVKVMTKEKKNIKRSVLNFYEKAVKGIKKIEIWSQRGSVGISTLSFDSVFLG